MLYVTFVQLNELQEKVQFNLLIFDEKGIV